MDETTWRRIERVFYDALDLDPTERPRFVERACAGNAELKAEVEALLDHHAREGTLFETREALFADLVGARRRGADGDTIGPYRVEREIGSGGMGRVFLARRDDLPKRVALKLVREPLASPERVRRFQLEQRVLARLEHAHIAQLLDAGVTDDGVPFFAMEYIDGEPLTTFCDHRRLPLTDRLRLFLDVCSAVRYAHTHLVVHRDIKPSNVLVTGDGRPKLLDFGVAKLLTPEGDPRASVTRTEARMFTPSYAAPEQFTGAPASTATDVYQLGALLFELTAGRPPFELAGKSPIEAELMVREEEPLPPSTAVTRGATQTEPNGPVRTRTASDISAQRSTTPERLRQALAGDVDNIVLKALEKEPQRRYASVDALANDIERFLQGLPVTARPSTPWYRLKKFVARNKVAAGVAALIVGYAMTATLSGIGIARERDRAEREAASASRVSDFLVDVFTRADPTDTVPGQATALELVDRAARQIDDDLAEEPETQAAMQEVLARVYHGLGREAEAEPLLRRSLATRLQLFGPESLEVASARHNLAQVLWAKGDLAGADTLDQQALAVRRARLDPGDTRLWETLNDLGTVRHLQGDLEGGEELMREVVGLVRSAAPDGHALLGMYLSNLANIRFARGDYSAAQATMAEALDSDRRHLPADHPSIAIRLDNLAYMALRAEAFDDALDRAEQALAMYWRVYGAPHPDMPYAMTTIASASVALGDTVKADSMHRSALDLRRSLGGPDNPDLYMSHRDLGRHLLATGRAADAQPHLEEAVRVARLARGERHEWFATALWHLGRVHEGLDDAARAEELLRRAHLLHTETLGPNHPVVAEEREYLAGFLRRLGRDADAAALSGPASDTTQGGPQPR